MPSMRSPSMGEGEVPCGEKQMSAVCVCTQTDTYLPMHPEGGMGIPEPTLNLQCGLPETRRSSVAMTESTTFLLGGKMQRPRLLHRGTWPKMALVKMSFSGEHWLDSTQPPLPPPPRTGGTRLIGMMGTSETAPTPGRHVHGCQGAIPQAGSQRESS